MKEIAILPGRKKDAYRPALSCVLARSTSSSVTLWQSRTKLSRVDHITSSNLLSGATRYPPNKPVSWNAQYEMHQYKSVRIKKHEHIQIYKAAKKNLVVRIECAVRMSQLFTSDILTQPIQEYRQKERINTPLGPRKRKGEVGKRRESGRKGPWCDVLSDCGGSVPLSQQGLHKHERERILRGPRGSLESQCNMRLLKRMNQNFFNKIKPIKWVIIDKVFNKM